MQDPGKPVVEEINDIARLKRIEKAAEFLVAHAHFSPSATDPDSFLVSGCYVDALEEALDVDACTCNGMHECEGHRA